MKYTILLLTSMALISSCGNEKKATVEELISSKNIAELQLRKKEIEKKQYTIAEKLSELNEAIALLDTLKKLPLVTTLKAEQVVFKHYLELQGNVNTKENILVYPEIPGILKDIYVKEGQSVKKGDVLALIDDGGMNQQLAQLEAQALLAQTSFERQERLWKQKIGSEMQYLRAKTAYQSQSKALEQFKSQLAKTEIKAPFDGTIDEVFKTKGTVIALGKGAEIFRIINLNSMYIEAEVPESYIGSITKEKAIEVYFPILNKTSQATIKQVSNFIDPNNRSFKIEVAIANKKGEIKPNLSAKLKINDYKNKRAMLIPQNIISENATGEQYIYTISEKNKNKEGIATKTMITTGKTQNNLIEILNILEVGTEIIVEGARSINNGQAVKIAN